MKSTYVIYILSLFFTLNLGAQNDVVTYSSSMTKGGIISACQGIILKPGFSYKATSGNNLHFNITTQACSPYEKVLSISTDRNYVVAITPLGETQSVGYNNGVLTVDRSSDQNINVLTEVQYFDGFGNLIQTVQQGITPQKNDLVSILENRYIRESQEWLPIPKGSNGSFHDLTSFKTDAQSYYKVVNPFRSTIQLQTNDAFDETYTQEPGTYSGSTIITNSNGIERRAVSAYSVVDNGRNIKLIKKGDYAYYTLTVSQSIDGEGNTLFEYTDKNKQLVLSSRVVQGGYLDTYYVYDDFGNLCFVLPPLLSNELTQDNVIWSDTNLSMKNYAYIYNYDKFKRCIAKKLPGVDWVYYVYDKADQLIFTQDGEQRSKGEWNYSISDNLGRIVLMGICKNSITDLAFLNNTVVAAKFNLNNVTNKYYDINGVSLTSSSILTANYYDNYDFRTKEDFSKLNYSALSEYGTQHPNSTGLLTGSIAGLLDDSGRYLYKTLYYDYKGNIIQSKSTNHLDGVDSENIAYNFAGSPVKKLNTHTISGNATQTELYTYNYDHAGRLLATKHKYNANPEIILAQNTYNELGQLQESMPVGQSKLRTSYTYNINSWSKTISNSHYRQTLDYTLNGNILHQQWEQAGKSRSYTFEYDERSQIKKAVYAKQATGDISNYSANYKYDNHGNIKQLNRLGLINTMKYGSTDSLTFIYNGNQLINVMDAAADIHLSTSADFKDKKNTSTVIEYTYNKNGGMTTDLNKGASIIYNSLNLPREMVINNSSAKAKNYYTYSATGVKLKIEQRYDPSLRAVPILGSTNNDGTLTSSITTDYVGNKIYEDGVLKKILVDNGYIEGNKYFFYIKDHLGNNRIVADVAGTVIQSNQYYPFGMSFGEETDLEQGEQNFKYNGKELDKTHGLNQYDYAARFMDPATVRFTSVDPLADEFYSWSPYVYCYNNSLKYIDPTGMSAYSLNNVYNVDPDQGVVTIIRTDDPYDLLLIKGENPIQYTKGLLSEEYYSSIGYHTRTTYAAGMSITDFGLSIFAGELLFAKALPYISKLGSQIGSKISKIISQKAKFLVTITESESGVIVFSAKIGTETIEGIANVSMKGDKLYLRQLHLGGSTAGKVGRSGLFQMARDLGRQYGAKEVVIEGGKRTTGKYVGQTPTPFTIKVD